MWWLAHYVTVIEHWLHCVVISYERGELLEKTLESYLATVTLPGSLVIVDNHSQGEKTLQVLAEYPHTRLDRNYYPGYAANRGWEAMPAWTTLLQRSDNDTLYLPGWDEQIVERFEKDPQLGQLGLVAEGDEEWTSAPGWPVGGNSIIRRELYDKGLRYTEKPWPELEIIEEHQLSLDVQTMGYHWGFSEKPGIEYLEDPPGYEEYRRKSYADRGLV